MSAPDDVVRKGLCKAELLVRREIRFERLCDLKAPEMILEENKKMVEKARHTVFCDPIALMLLSQAERIVREREAFKEQAKSFIENDMLIGILKELLGDVSLFALTKKEMVARGLKAFGDDKDVLSAWRRFVAELPRNVEERSRLIEPLFEIILLACIELLHDINVVTSDADRYDLSVFDEINKDAAPS